MNNEYYGHWSMTKNESQDDKTGNRKDKSVML